MGELVTNPLGFQVAKRVDLSPLIPPIDCELDAPTVAIASMRRPMAFQLRPLMNARLYREYPCDHHRDCQELFPKEVRLIRLYHFRPESAKVVPIYREAFPLGSPLEW